MPRPGASWNSTTKRSSTQEEADAAGTDLADQGQQRPNCRPPGAAVAAKQKDIDAIRQKYDEERRYILLTRGPAL